MKRRAIAVLAAIGLATTMLFTAAPAATAFPAQPGETYVALGDSVAAGTGNVPYIGDPQCLRSSRAYPELIAAVAQTDHGTAACAGATTASILAQLEELEASGAIGYATQMVSLTVGINNLQWQSLLAACLPDPTSAACMQAQIIAAVAVAALPDQIEAVLEKIRDYAPSATVAVTGYPLLFGQVSGSCSIGNWQGKQVKVSAALAQQTNEAIVAVNMAIGQGIVQYGPTQFTRVVPVDVIPAFAGHGLCDTGDRWISGLNRGVPLDRGLHPNAAGQQAYAAAIIAELAG